MTGFCKINTIRAVVREKGMFPVQFILYSFIFFVHSFISLLFIMGFTDSLVLDMQDVQFLHTM